MWRCAVHLERRDEQAELSGVGPNTFAGKAAASFDVDAAAMIKSFGKPRIKVGTEWVTKQQNIGKQLELQVLSSRIKPIPFHERSASHGTSLEYHQQGNRSNLKIHFFRLRRVLRASRKYMIENKIN